MEPICQTAFGVQDQTSQKRDHACDRVVDRLLKSPQYGKRIAPNWLDAVEPRRDHQQARNDEMTVGLTKRQAFFQNSARAVGGVTLASLVDPNPFAASVVSSPPHPSQRLAPQAKRIISLFMSGGPSNLDLFDSKPFLNQFEGPANLQINHQRLSVRENQGGRNQD